jgi:HicA toxin of bacterial toxin-antitoxin,
MLAGAPRCRGPLNSNVRLHKHHLRPSEGQLIADCSGSAIIDSVNGTQRKTLERVLTDPVNGNIEWARIESMLKAAGCRVVEGAGSSVTFEFSGRKMTLHRPHPGKEALRYRVLAAREFIERMGIKP